MDYERHIQICNRSLNSYEFITVKNKYCTCKTKNCTLKTKINLSRVKFQISVYILLPFYYYCLCKSEDHEDYKRKNLHFLLSTIAKKKPNKFHEVKIAEEIWRKIGSFG